MSVLTVVIIALLGTLLGFVIGFVLGAIGGQGSATSNISKRPFPNDPVKQAAFYSENI